MNYKSKLIRFLLIPIFCIFISMLSPLWFGNALFARDMQPVTPEDVGMSSEKLKAVDEIIQSNLNEGNMIGGIVMIARQGKVCFFKSYGLADRENKQPMRKDAILRIYSMSKSITTAAALMLYDEGKLDFYDPVSKYLPELKEMQVISGEGMRRVEKEMTVADLMRHTSGLTYGSSSSELHNKLFEEHNPCSPEIPMRDMPARLKHVPLIFEPGSKWEYGISTDVLGHVIEVVSGQTLDDFLRERFFEPLDMKDTAFYVPEKKWFRFASCYDLKEGKFELMQNEFDKYRKPPRFLSGGGGLVSTAHDYMRFLLMIERGGRFDGDRYLTPLTIPLMTEDQMPEEAGWVRFDQDIQSGVRYSFGFRVVKELRDAGNGDRIGEYGWGGAASTHYWISPKDELIVTAYEQVRPYRGLLQTKLKKAIYDAIEE